MRSYVASRCRVPDAYEAGRWPACLEVLVKLERYENRVGMRPTRRGGMTHLPGNSLGGSRHLSCKKDVRTLKVEGVHRLSFCLTICLVDPPESGSVRRRGRCSDPP